MTEVSLASSVVVVKLVMDQSTSEKQTLLTLGLKQVNFWIKLLEGYVVVSD